MENGHEKRKLIWAALFIALLFGISFYYLFSIFSEVRKLRSQVEVNTQNIATLINFINQVAGQAPQQ